MARAILVQAAMTAVTAVSLFGGNNLLSSEEVLQLVPQPLFDAATEEAHRKGAPRGGRTYFAKKRANAQCASPALGIGTLDRDGNESQDLQSITQAISKAERGVKWFANIFAFFKKDADIAMCPIVVPSQGLSRGRAAEGGRATRTGPAASEGVGVRRLTKLVQEGLTVICQEMVDMHANTSARLEQMAAEHADDIRRANNRHQQHTLEIKHTRDLAVSNKRKFDTFMSSPEWQYCKHVAQQELYGDVAVQNA